ncbi:MAG: YlbF family regulator [Lachnospiraceae bacterium]|nr:YlbF family regulator [Lachnospiraceae bacterium]
MTDLTDLSNQVSEAIRNTPEYAEFNRLLMKLKEDPQLYRLVDEMRDKNFMIHQGDVGDPYDMMDALTNEYEGVINKVSVSEFLQAEIALCRMIHEFNRNVTASLEID